MGGFLVYGCLLVARVGLRVFLHTESSKVQWKIHQLRFNWSWWVTTCSKDASLRIWSNLAFSRAVPLVFPSAWQLVSLFPDGCYHSPFYAVVIIESLWLVAGVFAFLWRLIAFMPVVVKPWVRMITFSWIVCQGKNVAFLSLRFIMRKLWPIVCSLR